MAELFGVGFRTIDRLAHKAGAIQGREFEGVIVGVLLSPISSLKLPSSKMKRHFFSVVEMTTSRINGYFGDTRCHKLDMRFLSCFSYCLSP